MAINKLLMLKRDPKDSLRSWAERFERYAGRNIEQRDIINVDFPTWVLEPSFSSVLFGGQTQYKEKCDRIELWCRENLSVEDYCIWFRSGKILLAFNNDDSFVLFKLTHSDEHQISKDKVTYVS